MLWPELKPSVQKAGLPPAISRTLSTSGLALSARAELRFARSRSASGFVPRGERKFAISHFLFDFYRLQGDKPDGFPLYRMTDQTK